jgi:hypothetical protein
MATEVKVKVTTEVPVSAAQVTGIVATLDGVDPFPVPDGVELGVGDWVLKNAQGDVSFMTNAEFLAVKV